MYFNQQPTHPTVEIMNQPRRISKQNDHQMVMKHISPSNNPITCNHFQSRTNDTNKKVVMNRCYCCCCSCCCRCRRRSRRRRRRCCRCCLKRPSNENPLKTNFHRNHAPSPVVEPLQPWQRLQGGSKCLVFQQKY